MQSCQSGPRENLGAVSEVRNKIAHACDWANAPVDEPVGSIPEKRWNRFEANGWLTHPDHEAQPRGPAAMPFPPNF